MGPMGFFVSRKCRKFSLRKKKTINKLSEKWKVFSTTWGRNGIFVTPQPLQPRNWRSSAFMSLGTLLNLNWANGLQKRIILSRWHSSIAATLVHISLKNLELPPTPMALFNLPLLHRQGTNLNQNNNLFFQPLRNVLTTTSSTTYQPHFHYYLSGWLGPVSHVFAQASRVSIHFQVLFMATTTKPSSCLW